MPATSSFTFKILLEGKEAIAEARRIRTELERELGQGLDFRQAQQQMGDVADLSRTTGANAAVIAGGLGQAAREGDKLVFDMREADDATRQLVSDLFRSGASAQQLEQALRGGGQAVEETRQQVKWLGRDLEEVAKMGRMERMGRAMSAAAGQTFGLQVFAGGMERMGRGMMATGAAIIGPLTLAGRSYLEFADDAERAARQLKLNADLTAELKSETLDLSASLGLFTPEEISQGLYTWASAIGAVAESQEDLDRLLKDSTEIQKLAGMNQEALGTTTEYVAGILGEFGMDTGQVNRTVSVLNYTADRTQATVSDLGQSFRYIGPIAASLGEDIESVAAAMGVAADAGIKGSMSGRALRQMFIRLVDPTDEMNEAFNTALGLSGELGQSWQEIAFPEGKFIGLANFIDLVAAATENMTDQQRMTLLAQMATANELPVLTALVTKQIDARREGINVLRAEEKIMTGVIDAEVRKYAEWKEATEDITVSLENATESWEREWQMYEDSDVARADRIQKRWDAAWKRIGEAAVDAALPALEKLADLMDRIGRYAEEHPEAVGAALHTGAILAGIGVFVAAAGKGIRLYADIKMITAAATMYQASTNMLEAAGIQAASNKTLLAGMGKLVVPLALTVGALAAEKYVVEKAGVPDWMQTQMARGMETYEEYVRASQEITQGRLEILTRAQWEAVHAGQELGDVLEQTGDQGARAVDDIWEEMRSLKEHTRETKKETEDLGSELMQLPPAIEESLAAFTEAELEAIDELEDYLRRRNDLIEEHNQELLDAEADFLAEQAEQYRDYMDERQDLLDELEQVTQDPLWLATEEVQESLEREQEALEEYTENVEDVLADHQKKLRDLREDHDDKMEDLEAARDAHGILDERRSYNRAVRDANEQAEELLSTEQERLDETLEEEREQMATLRDERQADIEEQLKELDEQYEEEDRKRQEAYAKELDDLKQQQAKELSELEKAHAQRLASIMGWEERIRQALRDSYAGREEDLRQHLFRMEQLYNTSMGQPEVTWTTLPFTGLPIPTTFLGMQAGGYAGAGIYQLGEAGREFVLNAPTTRALERATGPLTQSKVMSMTSGHFRLDIRVKADEHFSPAFEGLVRAEIVNLAKHLTQSSNPGAYRPS